MENTKSNPTNAELPNTNSYEVQRINSNEQDLDQCNSVPDLIIKSNIHRIEPQSDIQVYQQQDGDADAHVAEVVQEKRIFETCDEGTFKQRADECYDQDA